MVDLSGGIILCLSFIQGRVLFCVAFLIVVMGLGFFRRCDPSTCKGKKIIFFSLIRSEQVFCTWFLLFRIGSGIPLVRPQV